ncbi:MAG: Crp/Fnr family transcriptional regulator [Acidobacteria bacterium]|nr:Crp/Fnr family transcriptional regulator [Acidobacteriota bacterium]MBI3661538.1 Crp/Fnr family transcriptional regulator [Acidobacteriota bacterium]
MGKEPHAKSGLFKRDSKQFNPIAFLSQPGAGRSVTQSKRKAVIYAQGEPVRGVLYLLEGVVKLSVVSRAGKEGTISVLGTGEFFGECSLIDRKTRLATATAVTDCKISLIETEAMKRLLYQEHSFSEFFMKHLIARTKRIEENLIDQLFNSSERRLARVLLMLTRFSSKGGASWIHVPRMSQEVLAGLIGTTRSRVSFFMNKFRKKGYIRYNGGLQVNRGRLGAVLNE